jgi:hypothetical protein
MADILMSHSGPRQGRRGLMIAGVAGLALAALSGHAAADISPVIFHIEATNAAGTGSWFATVEQGQFGPGGTYSWTLPSTVELRNQAGGLVASLTQGNLFLIEDPVVSIGFAVQAGAADTVFTITSALLSFPGINPAEGRVSGAVSATDTNGNGVNMLGMIGGSMLTSRYNGIAPAGSLFANILGTPLTSATPFDSVAANDASPAVGFSPIPGTVTDISVQYSFSLSAGDIASGTGVFVVLPGPGAAGILGLAGLMTLRRRR